MGARVFISCGQQSENERDVADALVAWFTGQGFSPYVAVKIHTITDLNAGIIEAIKTSDYYVFINFPREEVIREIYPGGWGGWMMESGAAGLAHRYVSAGSVRRGSLYSHQELAVAYALGFDHILILNHQSVHDEGVQKFIVSNLPRFDDYNEVLPAIARAVIEAKWSPNYSRQLSLVRVRWTDPINYGDHTGVRLSKMLHGDIMNGRLDRAAYNVIAQLSSIWDLDAQSEVPLDDTTLLKASGFLGYQQTIWPGDIGSFDLLALSWTDRKLIFLNSSRDLAGRRPIIDRLGRYRMTFRFAAENYPVFTRTLVFTHSGSEDPQLPEIQ
jgi:hypothetical protein